MFRRCLLRCNPDDLVVTGLKKKLRVRYLVDRCPVSTLTTDQFQRLCTKAVGSTPSAELMTEDEAKQYLTVLHDARVVVVEGSTVYMRPVEAVNAVHNALGITPLQTVKTVSLEKQRALEKSVRTIEEPLRQTAVWRRRFWSGVAVASGTQMTVLAYLTFIQYDWDVMEPACYFVTCATSLFFYGYFLWFRREQSLTEIDETVLPSVLTKKLQSDPKVWLDAVEEYRTVSAQVKRESLQSLVEGTETASEWLDQVAPEKIQS